MSLAAAPSARVAPAPKSCRGARVSVRSRMQWNRSITRVAFAGMEHVLGRSMPMHEFVATRHHTCALAPGMPMFVVKS